ncbi:MAG: L-threonine 3-dehydrogenase [Spirochaetes bacterium GWF1_41_5]|nr:MAG: L-threonine 3-dehydrogenase [Spirochaetes bacterium GWF1_41_5]HBE04137.1 L-threonine 3-dehydrogenase [Spirochaetia bacterium]
MKALVKLKSGSGLWLEEKNIPEPGINDILIRVKKSAICGTDLHIYNWDEWAQKTIKTPITIGHEYVGHIAALGSGVKNFTIGDRVTGEGHIACGHCRNCWRGKKHICENTVGIGVHLDGCFAQYIRVPASNVLKISEHIDDDIVSIMDPFGNAAHTALSFPLLAEDVLITGAGLIGSMAVGICKFAGARNIVVTDLNEYRLAIARKMGATLAINPLKTSLHDAMQELNIHKGFDIGLEMSGSPAAFNDMISEMYNGGKIALLGILPRATGISWDKIIFKGLTLKGIYGREMFETWYKMEQMLLCGLDISPVITHRYHFTEFEKAFAVMKEGNCGKVILDFEN